MSGGWMQRVPRWLARWARPDGAAGPDGAVGPAASTSLYLVRHGHTADNTSGPNAHLLGWSDPPLSDKGREQVYALCEWFRQQPAMDALYTSPLRRAWSTAAPLGETLDLTPIRYDDLREINCGDVDGWALTKVKLAHADYWERNLAQADDLFCWPGGETYQAFRARCLGAIHLLTARHAGQRIVLVTHAGFITQVVGWLHGTRAAQWEPYRAGNASVTVLRWHGERGEVEQFDERSHLAATPVVA